LKNDEIDSIAGDEESLADPEPQESMLDAIAAQSVDDESSADEEGTESPATEESEPLVADDVEPPATEETKSLGMDDEDPQAEKSEPLVADDAEPKDEETSVLPALDDTEVLATEDTELLSRDDAEPPALDETSVLPAVDEDGTSILDPVFGSTDEPSDEPAALDESDEQPTKRRWPKIVGISTLVALIIAGAYVGAAYALADRVPRDTTVLGAEIGSLSSADAIVELEGLNETWQQEAVEVTAGGQETTFEPGDAGLAIDAEATVESVTGFSLDPRSLWLHLTGASEVAPVLKVDDAKLNATVRVLAEELRVEPVDASAAFEGAELVTTPAVVGHELRIEDAKDAIEAEWLTESRPIALPTTETEPDLTQDELDAFVRDAVEPLLAGPVTVIVGDHQIPLEPAVLASAQTITTDTGDFVLTTTPQVLHDAVMTLDPTLSTEPINARFDWNDAGPVLVPGADGVGIDVQAVSDAIMAATKTPERIAETDAVTVPPEVTTEYLESMGITEMIVHFSTPLTSEPTRTRNIRHATEFITGTLVPPGGRFDTLEVIGPITYANGYIDSGMVINGLHIDGLGGGLSQIGTMTFNAGFEAGYIDVEHHPHSYWFTRYPAGREATLSVPTKNVIWENDTPYGALLRAYVSGGRVYIEVWSTRYWDVSITDSGKYNIRPVQTEVSHDPRCVPYGGGNAGFTITVTRTKTAPDGTPGETWQQTTSYRPDNAYTCE
jgi:vancomycin resistance protein YoaR